MKKFKTTERRRRRSGALEAEDFEELLQVNLPYSTPYLLSFQSR